MNKVKNKKIIRKIADRTLKVKKSRNLIGILAIVLTSLLFTGVFTIGGNLTSGLKNMYGMIGGMLAFILALIGILNFLNTMAASILSRKQEFSDFFFRYSLSHGFPHDRNNLRSPDVLAGLCHKAFHYPQRHNHTS